MIQELAFTISGIAPLLMHNGRLAVKDDPFAQAISEISAKRKKVMADYEEMARLEFLGGLYTTEDGEVCIPGYVFEACIIGKGGAARKERSGKEAAANLYVTDDALLVYDGPSSPDELWVHKVGEKRPFVYKSLVRVQGSRITRTRPIFRKWSAAMRLEFDDEQLDEDQVRRWLDVAGSQVGLGDWRPKFGRFSVQWA